MTFSILVMSIIDVKSETHDTNGHNVLRGVLLKKVCLILNSCKSKKKLYNQIN